MPHKTEKSSILVYQHLQENPQTASQKEWDNTFAKRPFSNTKLCFLIYFTLMHRKLSTYLNTLQSLGKTVFTPLLILVYFLYHHITLSSLFT